MKVIVYSHSYLEPENQKNIESLSRLCEVRCIVPKFGGVNIWRNVEFRASSKINYLFRPYFPFYITKSQYILFSLTLGLDKFRPNIINIEYNPWSLQFIQLLVAKILFSPQATIVCTIKKNTHIIKSGFLGYIKSIVVKYTLGKVDHFIAVSQKVAEMLENRLNIPRHKISIAYQLGVDIDLFKPKEKTVHLNPLLVVGYCGRLDEEKGVTDLVDAMSMLNKNAICSIQLMLMGNGAYGGFLDEKLKEDAKKVNWLKLLPGVPNDQVVDFLNDLDVFVLPSRKLEDHEEHDAHSLMEALATGIPCMGTKSGIIPELLEGIGIIINPSDICEMSFEIRNLLRDNKLRQELSKKGREKAVDCFSLDVVAANQMNIFARAKNENLYR
jgi:glycosyltransferase involved in cell wall biosynthesis